ncbi:DUF6665 family protein [Cucumibacter marinus]|uniref:DUF6665 family protein n=1 Tax=Cucumibacter marinus TaxID=1121252 RepID=UPI0004065A33|nr:DUF6665 family protein [Cucumibacter marinus]
MSLRPPRFSQSLSAAESSLNVVQHEIAEDQAAALGHQAIRAEKAMEALHNHDASGADDPETRDRLVRKAAYAVWALFIQRELMGMRDHSYIKREYKIPGEVLNRMGEASIATDPD